MRITPPEGYHQKPSPTVSYEVRDREREIQLNAEFQRLARRDKKAFLYERCKGEENSRTGKTRDPVKKTGVITGTFRARMAVTKDRSRADLTEAEETKKRWRECTEQLCKKDLMTRITTTLWPLTQSQTSWSATSRALGSVTMSKASGGDGILAELFKILKDEAVKALPSTWQQIWKTQQWPQDWKCQFSFQSQRTVMPKNVQTTIQLYSLHMLAG